MPTPKVHAMREKIVDLRFTKGQLRKYELGIAPRIVSRLEQLAPECATCRVYVEKTDDLVALLPQIAADKSAAKTYRETLQEMEQHLHRQHKIVRWGRYLATWNFIGVFLGILLQATFDNSGLLAAGIALGLIVGSSLDSKAKKYGRIL